MELDRLLVGFRRMEVLLAATAAAPLLMAPIMAEVAGGSALMAEMITVMVATVEVHTVTLMLVVAGLLLMSDLAGAMVV
ncbi:hypothetical protein PsAD46_01338 [Pseudovibrio sp. Ad46]|nr:hypothetical protein PsAD46_01338 [Pseudovibrio sp. Ad46]KZK98914.1 hypothetical protein PsAD5_01537 [Pseudovibrio sp. Ad5]